MSKSVKEVLGKQMDSNKEPLNIGGKSPKSLKHLKDKMKMKG